MYNTVIWHLYTLWNDHHSEPITTQSQNIFYFLWWELLRLTLKSLSTLQHNIVDYSHQGFPDGSDAKESTCNPPAMFDPWVGGDPLFQEMATHSSILAWRIPMDSGAWGATVCGVAKSWTRLSDSAQHTQHVATRVYTVSSWLTYFTTPSLYFHILNLNKNQAANTVAIRM